MTKLISLVLFCSLISVAAFATNQSDDPLGLEKSEMCSRLLSRADSSQLPEFKFSGESKILGDSAQDIARRAVMVANAIAPDNFKKPDHLSVHISDGDGQVSSEGNHIVPSINWVVHRNGSTRQSSFLIFLHEYAHILLNYALRNTKGGDVSWWNAIYNSPLNGFMFSACHELFTDVLVFAVMNDGQSMYKATEGLAVPEARRTERDATLEGDLTDASTFDRNEFYSVFTSVRRFLWSRYLHEGNLEVNRRVIKAVTRAIRKELLSLPNKHRPFGIKEIRLVQQSLVSTIEIEMARGEKGMHDDEIFQLHVEEGTIEELDSIRSKEDLVWPTPEKLNTDDLMKNPGWATRVRLSRVISTDSVLSRLHREEQKQLLDRLLRESTSSQEVVSQILASSHLTSQEPYYTHDNVKGLFVEAKAQAPRPVIPRDPTSPVLQIPLKVQSPEADRIQGFVAIINATPSLKALSPEQKKLLINAWLRESDSLDELN